MDIPVYLRLLNSDTKNLLPSGIICVFAPSTRIYIPTLAEATNEAESSRSMTGKLIWSKILKLSISVYYVIIYKTYKQ